MRFARRRAALVLLLLFAVAVSYRFFQLMGEWLDVTSLHHVVSQTFRPDRDAGWLSVYAFGGFALAAALAAGILYWDGRPGIRRRRLATVLMLLVAGSISGVNYHSGDGAFGFGSQAAIDIALVFLGTLVALDLRRTPAEDDVTRVLQGLALGSVTIFAITVPATCGLIWTLNYFGLIGARETSALWATSISNIIFGAIATETIRYVTTVIKPRLISPSPTVSYRAMTLGVITVVASVAYGQVGLSRDCTPTVSWLPLETSIRFRCFGTPAGTINVFEVDLALANVTIASDTAAPTLDAMRRKFKGVLAINGGNFAVGDRHQGLLISNNRLQSSLDRNSDTAILWFVPGRGGITHARDWPRGPLKGERINAMQVGHRVIVNGEPHNKPDTSEWAVACTDGSIIRFAVTADPFPIAEFALWLVSTPPNGLGCKNAVLIDGGAKTAFSFENKLRHFGPSKVRTGAAIVVTPR